MELISDVLIKNGLLFAFVIVGAMMWISYYASHHLTAGRLHGSAVAIILGLVLAYFGGLATGGKKGLADIELFAGLGIMGGAMLRQSLSCSIVGSPERVRQGLADFVRRTGADELMVTAQVYDHAARVRSFEIAAQARDELARLADASA